MNLGTQTVTRKRAAATADDYGNDVLDWSSATTDATITGCSVQPGAGTEFQTDREASTVVYTVWAPLGADVTPTDRIAYAGNDYGIESIERWEVGTPLDHLVIRLEAVNG